MGDLTCPRPFCWDWWLSCGLFFLGLLSSGVSLCADLSSLGLLLMVNGSLSLCLILQCSLALWSLTLPHHARPHDRSAGSKLVIYDPYKMRIFPSLITPCLPYSFASQGLLLAWNHIVNQLLLQKPHSFGILLNLSNTFVTFWATVQRGEVRTRIAHPPAISSLSPLIYHSS